MNLHRVTRRSIIIATVGASLLSTAAADAARTLTFRSETAKASECSLSVNGSSVEAISTNDTGSVQMIVRLSPKARPGNYLLTFACEPYKSSSARVHVARTKANRHSHRSEERRVGKEC